MKVLIADALDSVAVERLRAAGHEPIVRTGLQGIPLTEALAGVEALLVRGATKVTAAVLQGAPSLRLVVRVGTGLDTIDVAAASERKVRVVNTPAANAVSVAELVFGLLIAFERHVAAAASELRGGAWEKTRHMGRELAEKRIGLVGFGRIGREVATRAHAFGMVTSWCDPFVLQTPSGFQWARRSSLEEILPQSDYLSLHLPLNDQTRGVIGASELAVMKPGAVIVNCARGGLVEEGALLKALQSGALRSCPTSSRPRIWAPRRSRPRHAPRWKRSRS